MLLDLLVQSMGVTPTSLETVPDPKGRVDYLASKLLEQGSKSLPLDAQQTYQAARPLIDGLLVRYLGGVRIDMPEQLKQAARAAQGGQQ